MPAWGLTAQGFRLFYGTNRRRTLFLNFFNLQDLPPGLGFPQDATGTGEFADRAGAGHGKRAPSAEP